MNINRKGIYYIALLGLISLGLLCSCSKVNKTGSLTWKLKDGTLTISGQGPMPNYYSAGPWADRNDRPRPDISSIIINEGVTNIGNNAFAQNCGNVIYVSIPGSVTNIGKNAFNGCQSMTTIVIPDGVINIDNFAFHNCSKLISIDIPDSVISIGQNAFSGCNSVLTVSLGKNVKFIGMDAFQGCTNILTVTSNNPIPPHMETRSAGLRRIGYWSEFRNLDENNRRMSAFDSVSNKCRLVVPDEFISVYKEDAEWNKFFDTDRRPIYVPAGAVPYGVIPTVPAIPGASVISPPSDLLKNNTNGDE